MAKDKKTTSDDDFGFVPDSNKDDGIGFKMSPEDKSKMDAYLNSTQPGMGESALAGAEQGLTLNHAPQIGAGLGAALEAGAGGLGMGPQAVNAKAGLPKQSLKDLYNEYLAVNKKKDEAAKEANPWSYGAGTVGGGILGFKGAGMLAKPAMTAFAEANPTLAATGQVMNKLAPGAIPATAIGAVGASGANPDVPLMSQENAENMAQGAIGGLTMSAVAPPAIQGVAQAAQKTARGTKMLGNLVGETLTGGEGANALNQGLKGELLIGKNAAKHVSGEVNDFAGGINPSLEENLNQLAKQKQQIIRIAEENGVRIDPDDIDRFMQEHMSAPMGDRSKVMGEMQQLKDLLEQARSGPEVKQITRRYFGNGNTEKGEFAQLFAKKQAEQEAMDASTQAKVTPTTQKEDFDQLFAEKQAEQQAAPGATDPAPLEQHYEPIQGSNGKVLGVIRQVNRDADGNFVGYKTIAKQTIDPDAPAFDQPKLKMTMTPTEVPGKSLGQIHQAQFDEQGNFLKYKTVASKLLSDEEAADFKDMAETVRQGGRDLTKPEELLDLYKNLKEKSKYGSEAFGTSEVQGETGRAIQNIQKILRDNISDLEPTDTKIAALKQAQEILGNLDDKDPYSAVKMLGGLIGKSGDSSVSGDLAQRKLADAISQIKIANPQLGHQIESQAMNLASKLRVTAAASEKMYLPRPLATPQAFAAKGANLLGYGISQTPEWMKSTGNALAATGTKAGKMLSNVLTQAAEKDDQSRNAIMFGLMQQPGYREMLKQYMPEAQNQNVTPDTQK